MPNQQRRFLLGWLDEQEAIAQLLGGRLPAQGEDITRQRAQWQAARDRVQARPEYVLPLPTLEPLPAEVADAGRAFLARPDVAGPFDGWDVDVGLVNLRQILSFQKNVATDSLERTRDIRADDWPRLLELCLPQAAPALTEMPGTLDDDKRGVSFASTNPNLRVLGFIHAVINGQPYAGFSLGFGPNFVQVVQYEGRWFIRDGYHRCYGLMRAGVDRIPALFIRAANAEQFGGNDARFLRWELIFGRRPAFLADFLDAEVSAECAQPLRGRVVRLSAAEFNVQL